MAGGRTRPPHSMLGFQRTRASALPWSEFSGLIITFAISSPVRQKYYYQSIFVYFEWNAASVFVLSGALTRRKITRLLE